MFADLTDVSFNRISIRAATGDDGDLDSVDRRTRVAPLVDSAGAVLVVGDRVRVGVLPAGPFDEPFRVIGHARGRDWILLAWRTEDGGDAYGTFEVKYTHKI